MPYSLLSFQSLGNSASLNGFVFCQQRLLLSILHKWNNPEKDPTWESKADSGLWLVCALGPPSGWCWGAIPQAYHQGMPVPTATAPKKRPLPPTFSLFPPLRNQTKKPSHWHSSENSSIFCSFPVQNK